MGLKMNVLSYLLLVSSRANLNNKEHCVRKILLSAAIIIICFPLNVVSKEPIRGFQFHGDGVPEKPVDRSTGDTGLAKVIKNVKLPNFESKTFGEAVDSYRYFAKKEWKETYSSNGKVYVDFTGWLKSSPFDTSSVSAHGVGIKFIVKSDGSYAVVMVSKVELKTDGYLYSDPLPDISSILKKLYGNIEIKL